MDKLEELTLLLLDAGIRPHVETSGTIWGLKAGRKLFFPGTWITCSPKIGCTDLMIKRCDELKLLVDKDFDEYKLTDAMRQHPNVFLCPINEIEQITERNVQLCYKLLQLHPNWRLSIQTHKLFNWR
jgi:organic radical activating enzyme